MNSVTRGKKQTFQYGNDTLSITELLQKPEIVGYLERNGPLTYASQREKLRKLLRNEKINLQQEVAEYTAAAQNPPQPPRVQDTRYGSQRRRANLSKKDKKGRVLFGPKAPEPPPRAPRRLFTLNINGENLTVRETSERYPQLRYELQKKRQLSEKSLHAKLRTWYRKDKIENNMLTLDPEIVPRRRRLLGNNVVGHHTINSIGKTSPRDFLNFTRNAVIGFIRERPRNKVLLNLICVMIRRDPATDRVIDEDQTSFNSIQESVFESTNLEEVYERMITKILESFSTYLKNGSGWVLKEVVRLDITLSRLRPLRGSSHIPLPKSILRKNALINMKNEDDECFKWAVTRALNPVNEDSKIVTEELREQSEQLNSDGIGYPTPCSERVFRKFQNNNDVSILVFGYSHEKIIPLYVPIKRRERIVCLFFLKN